MLCCNVAHTPRWPSALCHVVTKCSVKRTTKSALDVGTLMLGALLFQLLLLLLVFAVVPPLALVSVNILLQCAARSLIAQLLNIQLLSYLFAAVYAIDWQQDVIK